MPLVAKTVADGGLGGVLPGMVSRRRTIRFPWASSTCHAATQYKCVAQRRVGGRQTDTDAIEQRVREPARVYPAPGAKGCWMVEAPAGSTAPAPMMFSGPNAQKLALRYAYEAFGAARFFPF
jgi:hypothetical protein